MLDPSFAISWGQCFVRRKPAKGWQFTKPLCALVWMAICQLSQLRTSTEFTHIDVLQYTRVSKAVRRTFGKISLEQIWWCFGHQLQESLRSIAPLRTSQLLPGESIWPLWGPSLPQSEAVVLQRSNQLKLSWTVFQPQQNPTSEKTVFQPQQNPTSETWEAINTYQYHKVTCGPISFVLTRLIVSWFLHLRDTSFDFYWLAVTSWGQLGQFVGRPLNFKIFAGYLMARSNQPKYHWNSLPASTESYQRDSNQYHKVTFGQILFVLARFMVSCVLQVQRWETMQCLNVAATHMSRRILPPISIGLRWGAAERLGNFLEQFTIKRTFLWESKAIGFQSTKEIETQYQVQYPTLDL